MLPLLEDARYALRTLSKTPGFTAAIVVSVALGIAANATVFSVANGLLWGVLPVKDPGRMVMFSEGNSFSYPDYLDYRDRSRSFDGLVAFDYTSVSFAPDSKTPPQLKLGSVKPVADGQTLEAIIANRYEVMAKYARDLRQALLPARFHHRM